MNEKCALQHWGSGEWMPVQTERLTENLQFLGCGGGRVTDRQIHLPTDSQIFELHVCWDSWVGKNEVCTKFHEALSSKGDKSKIRTDWLFAGILGVGQIEACAKFDEDLISRGYNSLIRTD